MPKDKEDRYYLVRESAVPEVLLKVVEAKRLLNTGRAVSASEASRMVGISRSSFYKYKDVILPFHDEVKGRTVTFVISLDDTPGSLSGVLKKIADCSGNILTIHQSIPIEGTATLSISVRVADSGGDAEDMMMQIEGMAGVHYVKILGSE